MLEFKKSEAKEWARENFKGVENAFFPSFTPDLREVDEKGVRFDIQQSIKNGFFSTLFVPMDLTPEEMRKCLEIAVDEAKGKIHIALGLGGINAEGTIELAKLAGSMGVCSAMLSLPTNFHPKSEQEIYDFHEAVCKATDMAIVVYATHKDDFFRFHPSGFPIQLIGKLADIENVAVIKDGLQNLSHYAECYRLFGDKVLFYQSYEEFWPILIEKCGMQCANFPADMFQCAEKPFVVDYFNLMLEGEMDKGMEIYWQLNPLRTTALEPLLPALYTGAYPMTLWRYGAWLNGFNGGSLRSKFPKLYDSDKEKLRAARAAVGLPPCKDPDEDFYLGRQFAGS